MSQIDTLPPLRDVIRDHDLQARKSLGQNFLLDLNLTLKVARTAGDLSGTTVLEVGPGPGGLTRALLVAGARRVVAVEKDPRCLPALEQIAAHYPGRLEIVRGDALALSLSEIAAGGPLKIVANLPYNVGTQLLIDWITGENWPPVWQSLTLMFQKEVAERIVAPPGSKAYGRLGVLAGWRCHATLAFEVGAKAFTPPPKVTSAIVHLTPRASPLACDLKALEKLTAAAFGQRRKMLRASLKPLAGDAEDRLRSVGIEPTERAEQLSIEQFVALANAFAQA
ncbi:16S rRNA (adenine(1518)-N(6)/adenine(1519)-N(6))-dimethyltransferase RsmA [Stappia sp.]|uniref:16S rRNA (adenine(1518)-N(6)/adenine(1519)-N(6))- dimethyltransferase RsmA n=1 Tax=Stappia sp. TaxID=1870903 RepID=UPI003D13E7A6